MNNTHSETQKGAEDSLDSESSWFEENVRVFTEKEKVQAEWCESDSQASDCVNEQSPEKFNSTTSSFLDIIEEMSSKPKVMMKKFNG